MSGNNSSDLTGSTTTIGYFNSTTTLVKDAGNELKVEINQLTIEEKYNPYANREVQHPNGFLGAFMHIVKTSLGTGILAIPRAFKSAGLLVGLIGTIFVGLVCTHAIHILVTASQKVCEKTKTPSLGFSDTAEGVFRLGPAPLRRWSRFAKYFVEGGLFCIHYLADAVYLVIISISLTKFFEQYYSVDSWDVYIFKLILLGPLLICGQVRQLKHLVPFSFIANLMLVLTFGITGYYMFSGISEINIKDRSLATGVTGIPSFFSTVLFSMEGIGTIMPVENSMVKPKFLGCNGVLNSAMMVIISLYASIGFFGYYKFGDITEATITKNLPEDDIPAQVAQLAIAIAVFFSYMLVFYVPVDIAWSNLKDRIPESKHNISQIILRSVLIIVNVGIAIAGGQKLGTLIDLIGAIFLSTLGFFVPAFLDIIVRWDEGWGRLHWRLWKNLFIMLMSLFGLVSGSYYAFVE
ncbi:hypothetical protein GWI33_000288 [Rhynchophorus ferrugineus]|uniref:Amino acid transporter transmembrane domain-containing protein n=1 Tax=Rhynchophorus ferrugineus TaxID=354439 RepID=A0A834IM80_RHYFE|nr:hypothetical protein GWI33_000288 [Rhynchophorus ferrugineus]